jgi:chromosome partitioning protein
MPIVAIFNNKGGEGKSTVTVGLAEFLAANRHKNVLVIDLDAQASSSCALLGHQVLNAAIEERRTIVDLVQALRAGKKSSNDVSRFFVRREGTEARGSALAEVALLVPDGERMFDVESSMRWGRDNDLFRRRLKPALAEFDYVLIDLPGNLTHGGMVGVNGLAMSDFVVIPTKSSHMSLNGLPRTFGLIEEVRTVNGNGRPAILGFLLNSTDRRFQQYRSVAKPIIEAAKAGDIPPVFDIVWPPSPALESATDEMRDVRTLKERFGAFYDHARKAAVELEKKCTQYQFDRPEHPVARSIWQRLRLA